MLPFIVNCILNLLALGMMYFVYRRISLLTQQLCLTPEELYQQMNGLSTTVDERERAFDERIASLKDELASSNSTTRASSGDAQELHPMVKNLPHSQYDVNQVIYGEEYAK